jgi:fumarate reductase flavoprotein subunit
MKYPSILRFDEYFCTDLLVDDGRCQGVVAIEIATGELRCFLAKVVIIATGGAGRVYRYNTNGGIVTGDGMALAYRQGVPLQDMEFVQYHPTALPGTGLLITEGCRGEGAILVNKDGYRYLQDYGLGPETALGEPKNKYMELGPRDRLSQAFWHEEKKGRTIPTSRGSAVHLDLRHLGEKFIHERLPFICEVAEAYLGIDPVVEAIPVRPTAHYTMGGIKVDGECATPLAGLYAVGECASVGLHGANRLGSNSLAELVVFGKVAGTKAAEYAGSAEIGAEAALESQANDCERRALDIVRRSDGSESLARVRNGMADALEKDVGIYREEAGLRAACDELAKLKERYPKVKVEDTSKVFNTAWLYALELGSMLDVAETMAHSALERRESRGSHQRLDEYKERDDKNYLKHTLATYDPGGPPTIGYGPVTITKSQPAQRAYGAAGEARKPESKEQADG